MLSISPNQAMNHLQAEVEPLEGGLACRYRKQLDLIRRTVDGASCHRFLFNDHPDNAAQALDEALAGVS
jgi:hypothetical protein